jgi:hypothetical protein
MIMGKKKKLTPESLKQQMEERQDRYAWSHDEFWFDKGLAAFWDVTDMTVVEDRSVDACIPRSSWKQVKETRETNDEEDSKGRPPTEKKVRRIKPSVWLREAENKQVVAGNTYWPNAPKNDEKPFLIKGYRITKDGIEKTRDKKIYINTYRAPDPVAPSNVKPKPWTDLVEALYPEEAEHFYDCAAHMIQKPEEKLNQAILLSGKQRIGKDSILEGLRLAVGVGNAHGIDPDMLFDRFKPWLETVMLVIDETRPAADEYKASTVYNVLKRMIAAPPYTLTLEAKFQGQRAVLNLMRVFITTNDHMSMYLPKDDARFFVMHSFKETDWQPNSYFAKYDRWLHSEDGAKKLTAWLMARDLSKFEPKALPPKTLTHRSMSADWNLPDPDIEKALRVLDDPDVFFTGELIQDNRDPDGEIARLLKSSRKFTHKMAQLSYAMVPREDENGKPIRWIFQKNEIRWEPQRAYAKENLFQDRDHLAKLIRQRGQAEADRRAAMLNANNVTSITAKKG